MNTREYRIAQFEKIAEKHNEYLSKIQIRDCQGKTNYMDITDKELDAIVKILTK